MSGYKHATVTISQEEYRRLHEADMKKRYKEISQIKSRDNGQDEVILNLINQLEERERQLQSALSSMNSGAGIPDPGILSSLLNQNAIYYENLVATLRNSNMEVQDSFNSVTDHLLVEMQNDREDLNQNLQSIIADQQLYQNNEACKADAAHQWFQGCLTLVEFIQNQFDHERFNPGRLNRILRNLQVAENNYNNGFFESSLQTSQQVYLELSDMNFELEQLVLQWQAAFENTYGAIDDIVYQMVCNGKVDAIGLQGEELPCLVDLDYWTHGRFSQLLDHSRQLSANMIQDQGILTLDDLDRIYNQIIPVIRESFGSIVYEARLNALNSQLRMNIAEKALQALESHGFCLDSSGYSGDDMRSQYNAHLASPDGSEVTINVVPTERSNQEFSNELVVITSHPFLKTDHEARLQWEELSQSLHEYNLRVGRPEIIATTTEPVAEDEYQKSQVEQKFTGVER